MSLAKDSADSKSSRCAFESGLYAEILARGEPASPEDFAYRVSALAQVGRLEEAFQEWRTGGDALPVPLQITARFFMGIAATRVSRLKRARRLFIENVKARDEHGVASAYVEQGLGFYSFFIGRFQRAKHWARESLKVAIETRDGYMKFLATDLLGHSLVKTGRLAEGLELVRQASVLAAEHGNENYSSAFRTARLNYEAESGARPKTMVAELETMLGSLHVQDSYTRGNLVLELARQWTLRGRWAEARELLDNESSSIYAFGNRRQEMQLQMRLGEISFRQGDRFALTHFVRAARRCLDAVADRAFEIRLLGLEIKAQRALQGREPDQALTARLADLSREFSDQINHRMLYRAGLGDDPQVSEAEDPIHHLFLLSQKDPAAAAEKAIALGYLGLWPQFAGHRFGESFFTVLRDERSIMIGDPGGIEHHPKALSNQQAKLLQVLSRSTASKEKLVETVWGYEYDPARHDPMLYAALRHLRKLLGSRASWLETTDDGWRLAPQVRWTLGIEASAETEPASEDAATDLAPKLASRLNFRQIRALRELRRAGQWSVQDYRSFFGISTMTAFRDLDGLKELDCVLRTGKGRATRYHYLQEN